MRGFQIHCGKGTLTMQGQARYQHYAGRCASVVQHARRQGRPSRTSCMRGFAAVYRGKAAAASSICVTRRQREASSTQGVAHLLGLCQMQSGRPPAAGIWMPVVSSILSWSHMNACAHARRRCIMSTICTVDEGVPACSPLAHAVSYHPWYTCGDVHFANGDDFMVWSLLCCRQPALTWALMGRQAAIKIRRQMIPYLQLAGESCSNLQKRF